MKKALITGITGQDGAYLAKLLLNKNYQVMGITRNYHISKFDKLRYLNILDKINIQECDLLDISNIIYILRNNDITEIYNLSSQSSVAMSYEQPMGTFNFNTVSVLNLLEAIKIVNIKIKLYQASSSEMYGTFNRLPITEDTPMNPISPYGVSKVSSHWLISCYRESYGIFACSGILFNHESYLRGDNFFIKKIIRESILVKYNKQECLKVGNIEVKRDFGFAPDYVKAMYLMMQQNKAEDFIIASGRSIKLKKIILYVFKVLGINNNRLIVDESSYRPSEIMDIYGSSTKAKEILGWKYDKDFFNVMDIIIKEELEAFSEKNS